MQLSIRSRLFCLVGLMLILMIVLGLSGRHGMSAAGDSLQSVMVTSHTLRNHIEGDMMHDALHALIVWSWIRAGKGCAAMSRAGE